MKTKYITMVETVVMLRNAGVFGWRIVVLGSVIWAESAGNAYAVNINDKDPNSPAYLSMDLGLCQINTYWQGIEPSVALDPVKAVQWMVDKTGGGWVNLGLWSTYNSGAYLPFQPPMRRAAGL